jgi:hydroxymethylbilane synthase
MRDPAKGVLFDGARVGTSSLRRRCQLLEAGRSISVLPLRGNVDTRLRKLREGEYDVIVLAMAGLRRTNLYDPSVMRPVDLLPAPGQGALALQCRLADTGTSVLLAPLNHPETATCVTTERAVVAALNGDCHSPIAALATLDAAGGQIHLRVAVGARDGGLPVVRAEARGPVGERRSVVAQAIERLKSGGVNPGSVSPS